MAALLDVGSLDAPQCPYGHGVLVLVAEPSGLLVWTCRECSTQVSWLSFAEGRGFGSDGVVLPCRTSAAAGPVPVVINIQASGGKATAETSGTASSSGASSSSAPVPKASSLPPKAKAKATTPAQDQPTEAQLNYIRLLCIRHHFDEEEVLASITTKWQASIWLERHRRR